MPIQWSFVKTILVVFFLIVSSSFALGAVPRIHFEADYLEWFGDPPLILGRGKARLEYGDVILRARTITFNWDTLDLRAEEEVDLKMGDRELKAKSLTYNLETKKGELLSPQGSEGPIFYAADNVYVTPEEIELSGASFTTCDLSTPHYAIRAQTITIDLENEVVIARNAVIYIGKYPVFWAPVIVRYLRKENRIMLPTIGYSDFAGWHAKMGYHFYTSPRFQGIVRLDYMEKKGPAGGVDVSYRINGGKGELRTYYIGEKDTLNERWRLKLSHAYSFSKSTSLKVNVDRVSDEDFLKQYFPEEDGEIPASFLSWDHRKPGYNINLLFAPEVNPFKWKESIQRLPEITVGFPAQKIRGTGLYLGKGIQVDNFKKEEQGFIRANSFLDVSHPFTAYKRFHIEPKVGYHLFWYKDKEGKEGYRRIPYQELHTSFQINGGSKETWVYGLEPSFGYYHSTEDKDDFSMPFDLEEYKKKTEDIHPPHLIKLGLKHSFQYKKKTVSSGQVTIGYNLTEEKPGFSFLEGKLRLRPSFPPLDYLNLYFLYDYYDEEYKKMEHSLDLKGKSWHLNIGMEKDVDEDMDDFIIQGEVNLGEKWGLSGYRRYDLIKNEVSEEKYSIWRDLHCWGVQLSYQERPRIEYSITLYIKAFPEYSIKVYPEIYPYFKE